MKSVLTILALTAFIGIAGFGFAAMGNHSMGGHNDCIATVGQAALCPHEGPFAMAEMHAQFFQRMTSAIAFTFLLTVVVLAFVASLDTKGIGAVFKSRLAVVRRRVLEIAYAFHRHSLFSWLTLRQRGDAVFA